MTTKPLAPGVQGIAYTQPDEMIPDFASRGLVVISPDDLGIPLSTHATILAKEKAAFSATRRVGPVEVPEIMDVLCAPGLVAACNQLLGENWAIVPFTHNTPFLSGAGDQHWHKDDNGPFNGRKHRHHQAIQVEMLYYPQAVLPDMGPTATVPYSQYWTFNHEENHDNFAGADHLDFAYQLSGMERTPVSGPKSEYAIEDIVNRTTLHDERMRKAVLDLKWPLCQTFEAAPLEAGSVVLYSHNLLHRGNHRRDDWQNWKDNPRFMWRFWLYRTTDAPMHKAPAFAWRGLDPVTGVNWSDADEGVRATWLYHASWLATGCGPQTLAKEPDATCDAPALAALLYEKDDEAEPTRIGAAYQLAASGDSQVALAHLRAALYTERENVRRAATYGLVALGEAATPVLIEASRSPVKWIRRAAAAALGDAGGVEQKTLDALAGLLASDSSVYVRSVAASGLGCLARRAIAAEASLVPPIAAELLYSLSREENRPGMDKAQGRSIKFVRPTDESDVCEGIGINYGLKQFEPVRSAVRENALWSLVILCSHGTSVLGEQTSRVVASMQEIARTDKNIFCAGFALDALNRLGRLPGGNVHTADVDTLLAEMPARPWESFACAGMTASDVARLEAGGLPTFGPGQA